jgi:anti-anti-sigma factor
MADDLFETALEGDALIVRCKGRFMGDDAIRMRDAIKPLIAGASRVTLDLTSVAFMDSIGLGVVASLYVSSRTSGRRFDAINLSPRVRDLFSVTHLLSLFESCGEHNIRMP